MGRALAALCAVAAFAALSTAAHAQDVGITKVGVFDPVLKVDAALGMRDSLRITRSEASSTITVDDASTLFPMLRAGPGCTTDFNENSVRCPLAPVARIEVSIADRDDRLFTSVGTRPVHADLGAGDDFYDSVFGVSASGNDTIIGGLGDDHIDAEAGSDKLFGDAGTDELFSRDGEADTVSCGIGFGDRAVADLKDTVGGNCENVDRAAVNEHPTVRIRGVVAVGRALRVRLVCPRNPSRRCRGRLTAKAAGRQAALGAASYRIGQGRSKRVMLPLTTAGRRYLTGRRRRVVRVTARERDRTGRAKTTLASFRLRR